jgi:hypothetical protein
MMRLSRAQAPDGAVFVFVVVVVAVAVVVVFAVCRVFAVIP